MSASPHGESLSLELGDIIRIKAPTNAELNNHIFLIQYLDPQSIELVDDASLAVLHLGLTDGTLDAKGIETIEILSRPKEKGYARQNGLLPGTWISIDFGGDAPATISGRITSLEEDMIGLKPYPHGAEVYIDFGYKGLPANLPIESIKPFASPSPSPPAPGDPVEAAQIASAIEASEAKSADKPSEAAHSPLAPSSEVEQKVQDILLDADQVVFGEELGEITELIPVPEQERRYGLTTQVNDLLDELLSTIPGSARTRSVLNRIHTTIERYKQLRTMFSVVAPDGEIGGVKAKGLNHKPLVASVSRLEVNVPWLIPLVRSRAKIYDVPVDEEEEDIGDILPTTLAAAQTQIYDIVRQFRQNVVPDGENKYQFKYRELNALLTPFARPLSDRDVISSAPTNANLTTIADSLDDFQSTRLCGTSLANSSFVVTRYNVGLTRLASLKAKSSRLDATEVPLTQSDRPYICGALMLPRPVMQYSKVGLPSTSIMERANLNLIPFGYWEFLGDGSTVSRHGPKMEHGKGFLDGTKAFLFQERTRMEDRIEGEAYEEFLRDIVPATRRIFNLIRGDIDDNTSYLSLVQALAPYLIYPDDITIDQYQTIVEFAEVAVRQYKQVVTVRGVAAGIYRERNQKRSWPAGGLDVGLLVGLQDTVTKAYKFTRYETAAEVIRAAKLMDAGRLLTSALSVADASLYQPTDVEAVVKQVTAAEPTDTQDGDVCPTFTLAKQYMDRDEVVADNGTPDVFFDARYDPTRYGVKAALSPPAVDDADRPRLMGHLTQVVGLSEANAAAEADAMLEGRRRVKEGDYARIHDEVGAATYYRRTGDHRWEPAGEDLDPAMFCNLRPKCLQIKSSCGTLQVNAKRIRAALAEEIMARFEQDHEVSVVALRAQISDAYQRAARDAQPLQAEARARALARSLARVQIGKSLRERNIVKSPYSRLRDMVLGQTDFVKKQRDIQLFVGVACRPFDASREGESPHWFYCVDTGKPLLPTFFKRLADAYFADQYKEILARVVAERGRKSDDGDKVVDKYSGYVIRHIEYSTEEGYDEAGFKIVSREVLEEDIQDLLGASKTQGPVSEDARLVHTVVKALQDNMGISLSSEIPFITAHVTNTLTRLLPTRLAYRRLVAAAGKRGRKAMSYQDKHDDALMTLTLGYYVVALQTLMPSVRTSRTFPGCVRAFRGFPLGGSGDLSTLRYVACVAMKLRSRARPWQRVPGRGKKGEQEAVAGFIAKLKRMLDKMILPEEGVKARLKEKRAYMLQEAPPANIPPHFDVRLWLTFLPPLRPVRVSTVAPLGPSFASTLKAAVERGSPRQERELAMLLSKVLYASLHIIGLVERVVNREAPLLLDLAQEPILENACCNEGVWDTFAYFLARERGIAHYDDMASGYMQLYSSIVNLVRAPYIFDPIDTKLKYPPLPTGFSESTIYQGFIKFCALNSGAAVDEGIAALCGGMSTPFGQEDTLEDKIAALKADGRRYTREDFTKLLAVVNRQNIVPIDLHPVILTSRRMLEGVLVSLRRSGGAGLCSPRLLEIFDSLLDTFDINIRKGDAQVNEVVAFLDGENNRLQRKLGAALREAGVTKGVESALDNLGVWALRGDGSYISREDERAVALFTFLKTTVKNVLEVYPNIICERVKYDNPTVPLHWKLSLVHYQDVQRLIGREISPLYKYYGDDDLLPLLRHVQRAGHSLIALMERTPFFADIYATGKVQPTILNGRVLRKVSRYYVLCALSLYLDALNELPMTSGTKVALAQDTAGHSASLGDQILRGRQETLGIKVAQLLGTYLSVMGTHKKLINISNDEIKQHILKAKEKEKAKITGRLGDMTVEEREVEDLLKNHRLGDWGLGQTRALFEYDPEQYDKERAALEQDALDELKVGVMDGVTERNRDIYRMEHLEEEAAKAQVAGEQHAAMLALPDDDDYGDRDGDEAF
jgi:hypothetical protein